MFQFKLWHLFFYTTCAAVLTWLTVNVYVPSFREIFNWNQAARSVQR